MFIDDLKKFFDQLNFKVLVRDIKGATILGNQENGQNLICVLVDNTKPPFWGEEPVKKLYHDLLLKFSASGRQVDFLFLVASDNIDRDKALAGQDVPLWLADSLCCRLMVFDSQPEDFHGIRPELERVIAACGNSRFLNLNKKNIPWVTIALVVLNLAYYLVLVINGDPGNAAYMVKMGADYWPLSLQAVQIWRFLTAMFMHFSVAHLAGNMLYLGLLGSQMENAIGRWKFLLIYMVSGLGASLVSSVYYELSGNNTVSAGASAAIYGLIGVMLYMFIVNWSRTRRSSMLIRVGILLLFLFYSNFVGTSGIDIMAHAAGLAIGMILSLILLRKKKPKKKSPA